MGKIDWQSLKGDLLMLGIDEYTIEDILIIVDTNHYKEGDFIG